MRTEERARGRGRRPLTTGLVAMALAAGVAHASPAEANSFGYYPTIENSSYFADNSNHTWYPWSLGSEAYSVLSYAMNTRLEATDMTTDEFQSQDANTDVVAVDAFWPQDEEWYGQWECIALVSTDPTRCNKGYLRFNLSTPHGGTPSQTQACHEVGHSVGLGHSGISDSCMQSPAVLSATNYSTHDRTDHINVKY